MADWCRNILEVRGAKSELRRFKKFAATNRKKLDEQQFVPQPQDQLDASLAVLRAMPEMERQHWWTETDGEVRSDEAAAESYWYNHGGFGWRLVYWGAKWGISEGVTRAESPRCLRYRFATPYTPPIPVIMAMSRSYPTLRFTLKYKDDPGNLHGKIVAKGGRKITNEHVVVQPFRLPKSLRLAWFKDTFCQAFRVPASDLLAWMKGESLK